MLLSPIGHPLRTTFTSADLPFKNQHFVIQFQFSFTPTSDHYFREQLSHHCSVILSHDDNFPFCTTFLVGTSLLRFAYLKIQSLLEVHARVNWQKWTFLCSSHPVGGNVWNLSLFTDICFAGTYVWCVDCNL